MASNDINLASTWPASLVTVPVRNDSDGQHAPSKDSSRNDGYFKERLGGLGVEEHGQAHSSIVYGLDRLPTGYSGWEEKRRGESKHIDRYVAKHLGWKDFRPLNEAWPHFPTSHRTRW
ncbi:unnamed protein product [Cercospora beticola]|nr:unnamed protein product [Cercospora beticola]